MMPLADTAMPQRVHVHDLTQLRIERALRQRVRYRYVQPQVQSADEGWLISSPCCSRNVDPEGGEILIARITLVDGYWSVSWRDHEHDRWVLHALDPQLQTLLDVMCVDTERVFWP